MFNLIPANHGVGVSSLQEQSLIGYRQDRVGRYFNYYFTKENWKYPTKRIPPKKRLIIDGFSPNLNKELHIGHLRNLTVASSLEGLFPEAKMVAMLGASVGINADAQKKLQYWYDLANYHPTIYLDNELSNQVETSPGQGEQLGAKVWQGPKGPVIVIKSDNRSTYAHHDLNFAKQVGPTHYVTGAEQKEHFESLGLGEKHLAMGLVLGTDGKKISSRNGAFSAQETLDTVISLLKDTPEPINLAWNVIVWNFLRVNRAKNIMFKPSDWTKVEAPGMYISYTYARLLSALSGQNNGDEHDINDHDVHLLGLCSYMDYYQFRSMEILDASALANFLPTLCQSITSAYHREKIKDGRPGFIFTMRYALNTLSAGMNILGMKSICKV